MAGRRFRRSEANRAKCNALCCMPPEVLARATIARPAATAVEPAELAANPRVPAPFPAAAAQARGRVPIRGGLPSASGSGWPLERPAPHARTSQCLAMPGAVLRLVLRLARCCATRGIRPPGGWSGRRGAFGLNGSPHHLFSSSRLRPCSPFARGGVSRRRCWVVRRRWLSPYVEGGVRRLAGLCFGCAGGCGAVGPIAFVAGEAIASDPGESFEGESGFVVGDGSSLEPASETESAVLFEGGSAVDGVLEFSAEEFEVSGTERTGGRRLLVVGSRRRTLAPRAGGRGGCSVSVTVTVSVTVSVGLNTTRNVALFGSVT